MTKARFANFDLVAAMYPALEWAAFGRALDRARTSFLDRIMCCDRLLLIGEGNGRFLADCLRRKTGGSITVVDSSAKMLSLLRSRIRNIDSRTSLQLLEADFLEWNGDARRFDATVTHFFLDLFKPARQRVVIEKIGALSGPDGIWVDVDFQPGAGSMFHRTIDWLQYQVDHRWNGVEADRHYDSRPLVRNAGWTGTERRTFCGGFVAAELRAMPEAFVSPPGETESMFPPRG